MTNDSASGAIVVTGSAVGALLGGVPGAIAGAILGSVIQEIIRCPKCGGKMNWSSQLKKHVCMVCGHHR